MKAPITTAQAMAHPDVALTINTLGKVADELRAERDVLREALKDVYRTVGQGGSAHSIYVQIRPKVVAALALVGEQACSTS